MNRFVSGSARGVSPAELPHPFEQFTGGTGTAGQLVLARVLTVGAYPRVENLEGRDVVIRPGDEFVGVLGERYSSTSIYGGLPEGGLPAGAGRQADLLAVGGLIGLAASSPGNLGTPTRLELLGLVSGPGGDPVRLVPKLGEGRTVAPVLLVGGTAAEVGKTTFGSALVHHLSSRHGLRVGVTKLAGTGRRRDLLTLADAGAHCAADFVDAGLASTYGHPAATVTGVARHLLERLTAEGAEVIVAELGGDLWAGGIPALLADPVLAGAARGLVLVPSDSMASLGVETWVRQQGLTLPTVHGVPRRNVVAARERLGSAMGVEPVDPFEPADLDRLCGQLLADLTDGARRRADDSKED
ncbi:hypothetical protein ACIA8O_06700 [Kitasatospora sp. NPDC051853]|uniref:hypothetical protein n=1 Tax=Kitasatospora sp. NPDC051853 TaxID=3364058 RepID=UPI0037919ECC